MSEHATLMLVRHGQSTWNALVRFGGWVDVPLTERGRDEARRCGELLSKARLLPDVVHTSLLRRAISTADLALDAADRTWIDVRRSWRLNERHYGSLQGKSKEQIRAEFGEDQYMRWRRSYHAAPPPIDLDSEHHQSTDPRYAELRDGVPRTESLEDVVARLVPYWESAIVPDLRAGRTVLVVAHGNSLRALVKHLENLSDSAISGVNIPTGVPMRYDLTEELEPVTRGGIYLDPEAAEQGAAAVAAEGRTPTPVPADKRGVTGGTSMNEMI
ncbi:phosphoglyceromutase [Saccharopolyspora sp. TS4A08]|uniref:2,3-bisphosphoglycerate-dependent phosphoglycerate mutase n=1 Tax=Saccharopolyspora ipomoeae TaxID=3042027 RepID=A0ABT6PRU9_9PSEU|nr:phosphoglyceromutase [Saccharopolyspora sp. TS4A08]MDI2030555.1 phosphoglyceromutase [Saccharopolyspora sp. TS4A08]